MSWNHRVRQLHRWTSVAFTAAVIANFIFVPRGQPPTWVTYAPLVPLAMLFFTGLYLFALPSVARWRGARRGA